MRFLFSVYSSRFPVRGEHAGIRACCRCRLLAMFAASFIAVFQTDLKRMLAYSSVAQIGYMPARHRPADRDRPDRGDRRICSTTASPRPRCSWRWAPSSDAKAVVLPRHRGARQADAAGPRAACRHRRAQPDRCAGHRRLRVEMDAGARRVGKGLVAVALLIVASSLIGGGLYLARARGALPPAGTRGPRCQGSAAGPADPAVDPGTGLHLVRSRCGSGGQFIAKGGTKLC